jgi:PP-loop superfamily ATP-utilizing enzyme
MDEIASNLRELGFLYVCMELSGYERGSLNRALRDERILR